MYSVYRRFSSSLSKFFPLTVDPFSKALYIFWSFGIIGLTVSQFENRLPLKPVLGGCEQCCIITFLYMNRLNKTESAIFVSLM